MRLLILLLSIFACEHPAALAQMATQNSAQTMAPVDTVEDQLRADQIAAILDEEVITFSELIWYIRDRGFPLPEDAVERRDRYLELLRQLAEQELIAREALETPFIQVTSQDVDEFLERRRQFQSVEEFQGRLEEMGMTEANFREAVRRRIAVNRFIELRFAPFVIVLPDQIREYYEEAYLPELQEQGLPAPALESVEESIRDILTQQQINQELDRWIRNALQKARLQILLFRNPALAPNLPRELQDDTPMRSIGASPKSPSKPPG